MGYVCKIRHGVLFGPKRYGSYGLIKIFTDQGIGAIKLLLGNLRSKSEVLLVLLILLSLLKLHSGIQKSYLDCCHCKVPYVPIKCRDRCSCISLTIDLWIANLRKFLEKFSGSIQTTNAWVPQIQWQHNYFIIHNLVLTPTSKSDIRKFNACRMYLQVFFESELDDFIDRFIPSSFLTIIFAHDSNCHWKITP